jgi:plastocyanin
MKAKMVFPLLGVMLISLCYVQASSAGFPASYKYTPTKVTGGGTITGVVTYSGDVPKLKPIEVNRDPDVCGKTPKYDESLVVGAGNTLKYALVYLLDISKGMDFPTDKTYEIDQHGCQFIPHVQVVPLGQKLTMLNSDGILHNIHLHGKGKGNEMNIAQPKFRKQLPIPLGETEIGVKIGCDVHNWMGGWVSIMPHPYYAVTNEKGEYKIENVPPGTYKLVYWHEYCGTNEKEPASVTVAAGGSVTQNFTLKKAAKK